MNKRMKAARQNNKTACMGKMPMRRTGETPVVRTATGGTPVVRKTGFTLVELMVTVAVLAILVSSFGTILVNAQRLVAQATAIMRANTSASAIEQTLREDLACMSSAGFISLAADGNGNCSIYFTSAGTTHASVEPETAEPNAMAGIIAYGVCPNSMDASTDHEIFWRGQWVLNNAATGDVGELYSDYPASLMDLQMDDDIVGNHIDDLRTAGGDYAPSVVANGGLPYPAESLNDLKQTWKLLCAGLQPTTIGPRMIIEFSDGETVLSGGAPKLVWKRPGVGGVPSEINWTKDNWRTDTTGVYNWPCAFRFKFTLGGNEFSAIKESLEFEFVISASRWNDFR